MTRWPDDKTNPGSPVSVIPTQIMALGRYFALDEFLRQLERLPRISRVTNLAVNPGPGGAPQLQLSVTAEFYTTDASAASEAPIIAPAAEEGSGC